MKRSGISAGLAGSGNATTQFYSASPDNGIQSYAIGDGTFALSTFPVVANGAMAIPTLARRCSVSIAAKPFVLMFGDAFPSHDSDQLPGAQAWTQAPIQVNPTPNDTGLSMSTLLSNSQDGYVGPDHIRDRGGHRRHDRLVVFSEGHDHLSQYSRPLPGRARQVWDLLSPDAGPLCQDHGPARGLGE